METMPDRLAGRRYYDPGPFGYEKEIRKRMDWWAGVKARFRSEKENAGT